MLKLSVLQKFTMINKFIFKLMFWIKNNSAFGLFVKKKVHL